MTKAKFNLKLRHLTLPTPPFYCHSEFLFNYETLSFSSFNPQLGYFFICIFHRSFAINRKCWRRKTRFSCMLQDVLGKGVLGWCNRMDLLMIFMIFLNWRRRYMTGSGTDEARRRKSEVIFCQLELLQNHSDLCSSFDHFL